jgi:hypothetical protein
MCAAAIWLSDKHVKLRYTLCSNTQAANTDMILLHDSIRRHHADCVLISVLCGLLMLLLSLTTPTLLELLLL